MNRILTSEVLQTLTDERLEKIHDATLQALRDTPAYDDGLMIKLEELLIDIYFEEQRRRARDAQPV